MRIRSSRVVASGLALTIASGAFTLGAGATEAAAATPTPGVTATKGMAWVVEGKLNYMQDPAMKDKDPGTFNMFAVPLPKS